MTSLTDHLANTGHLRDLWNLDPDLAFLNHGSFGACPEPVLAVQRQLRDRLEANPVRFLGRELQDRMDEAFSCLASLLGCQRQDLVAVPNATHGVNMVLRSLTFEAGDEILVTDHTYNACRNAVDVICATTGSRCVIVPIAWPVVDPAAIVRDLLATVTPNTRLALIDHVTSPTALILPIAEIVQQLQANGVDVLVDGAHGPGQVPLNLDALGAAYYTGNCHKWLCSPKGAAFLHVRRDRQARIRPMATSHGHNDPRLQDPQNQRSHFLLEFDQFGTSDPTPWLAIPAAVDFLQALYGDLPALMAENHARTLQARKRVAEVLQSDLPCPDAMIGAMASVELTRLPQVLPGLDPLHVQLDQQFNIEIPVLTWPSPSIRVLRLSIHAHTRDADVERLCAAVQALQIHGPTPQPRTDQHP